MSQNQSIESFHKALGQGDQKICDELRRIIDTALGENKSKIWHAHPVWFIDGNPIVGYNSLKSCVRLLFWSGQSFDEDGLDPTGTFKAAEVRYTDVSQIDEKALKRYLKKSETIQWDYKNIYKHKGELARL